MTLLEETVKLYARAINEAGINSAFVMKLKDAMGPNFGNKHVEPCQLAEHNFRTYGNALHQNDGPTDQTPSYADGVQPGEQITRFKVWNPAADVEPGKSKAAAPSNAKPPQSWNPKKESPTASNSTQSETPPTNESGDAAEGEVVETTGISDFDFSAIKDLAPKKAVELYPLERLQTALKDRGIEFDAELNARQLVAFIKTL